MGVNWLESFITSVVADGTSSVLLLNEISEWRRTHSDCLIVIDGVRFTSILTKTNDTLTNICGGNYRLARKQLHAFFKILCDYGATLVFFYDGPQPHRTLSTVKKHPGDQQFKRSLRLFDDILNKQNISTIINQHRWMDYRPLYSKIVKNACELYGKLHFSFDNERVLEMAKYATDNNAMAILGQHSNFLIYEGNWRYWSIPRSILYSDFRTIEFNRSTLREKLGLSQQQMPLLATLGGNDIIIDSFFEREKVNKFKYIALFIKRNNIQLSQNLAENDIKCIAEKISNDPDLIKKSIKSYDTVNVNIKYFEESTLQKISYGHSFMYNLFNDHSYRLSNGLYDSRQTNILLKDIFLPIHKRLAGILLKHKNNPSLNRTIKFYNINGEIIEETFQPEYPKMSLPELDILIKPTGINYTQFSEIKRFELFSWIITDDIKQLSGINFIDRNYMIVNATLYYLVKEKQICVTEADCILSMVYAINENKTDNEQIKIEELNLRGILVLQLYKTVHSVLERCCSAVGLEKYIVDTEIDGRYFQHLINMLTNKPEIIEKCINSMGSIQSFYHLCK